MKRSIFRVGLLTGALCVAGSSLARAEEDKSTRLTREAATRVMPAKPADPWSWASKDGPKQFNREYFPQTKDAECSAAHDHCLPAWVWFVEDAIDAKDKPLARTAKAKAFLNGGLIEGSTSAEPRLFGLTGAATDGDITVAQKERAIAYRTVPATRAHLIKGALAIALDYPTLRPESEMRALVSYWRVGVVKSVDWDAGKVYFVGKSDPYFIAATRVAVLRWQAGGKVEVIAKGPADALTPAVVDTFNMAEVKAPTTKPQGQVGADGQPVVDADTRAFEKTAPYACDTAHNHCMRPWTWLSKGNGEGDPMRFIDGQMQYINSSGEYRKADGAKMYFLTEPAAAAKLKAGTRVFYRDTAVQDEGDANGRPWNMAIVDEVEPELDMWKAKGDDRLRKIALARVGVIKWFPGEKAEAVK